jgi:ABC-2 type transport system permease protein
VLGGAWAALVIYAVMGVGIGALLRNQVGAIVGSLVYLFVVEGLVLRLIPALQPVIKWLPGGALEAMTATLNDTELLEPWQGALVLLGYGLLAAIVGTLVAVRRDIV